MVTNLIDVIDGVALADTSSLDECSCTSWALLLTLSFAVVDTLSKLVDILVSSADLGDLSLTVDDAVDVGGAVLGLVALLAEASSDTLDEYAVLSNAITCGVSTIGGGCWSALFATSLTLNIVVPANLALEAVLLGRSASVLGIVANRAWLLLVATKWTVVTLWAWVAIVHRQASWSGRSGLSLADIARGAVNALVGQVESGVESTATGETGTLLVPVLGVARTVLTRWAWNFSWAAWWAVSTKLALDVLISSAWAVETWWTLLWLTGTWWAVRAWLAVEEDSATEWAVLSWWADPWNNSCLLWTVESSWAEVA